MAQQTPTTPAPITMAVRLEAAALMVVNGYAAFHPTMVPSRPARNHSY